MKKITSALVLGIVGASASLPAHAQFLGVFQGVINAANQVTGKLGNRLLGGEKPVNLEEERSKFQTSTEAQLSGMDEPTRRILRPKLESSWAMAEQSFLLRNAQAYKSKLGPLLDLKQVATSALGGLAVQANIGSALGGSSGLGNVLSGAAMDGILTGVGAQPGGFNPHAARMAASQVGASSVAGMPAYGINPTASIGIAAGSAVSGAVSNAISSGTQKILADSQIAADTTVYEIHELNHPLVFFEKHPGELFVRDLYRENGNLGWKKIDSGATAEAYAPVAGDDVASAAVFNFDAGTQKVNAAFRIVKAGQMDFIPIVRGISKAIQAEPRYASQGDVLRAVWESGAFVTADSAKVTVGWSHLVPQTFRTTAPVAAQAMNELAK